MPGSGPNLLVFRETRHSLTGEKLRANLARELRGLEIPRLHPQNRTDQVLAAMLAAGELECAIADSGAPVECFQGFTDWAAALLLDGFSVEGRSGVLHALERAPLPETLMTSTPEGFAYYALHPCSFAAAVEKIAVLRSNVAVIGIRSIGTTLS